MIPKEAKLVFKGILFDVYQWQQEMFDGTFKTYERLRRKSSVTILPITEDGRIILGREEQPGREPFVSIPGGQVEVGEKPEDAARREFLEETGYEARDLVLWKTVQPYGNKVDWDVYGFIARGCKKVAEQNLDSGEKIQLELVSFDEFKQSFSKLVKGDGLFIRSSWSSGDYTNIDLYELDKSTKKFKEAAMVSRDNKGALKLTMNNGDSRLKNLADKLYEDLTVKGVEVLYDDRADKTAGEKFADADLIGCPVRLVVSKKTLAQDSVELKYRNKKEFELIKKDKIIEAI